MSVLVIGAGPAGLAAAAAARDAGAAVTVLDAGDGLGGQYWRHLPDARPAARERVLHHGWATFAALRDRLAGDAGCEIVLGAQVWAIDRADGRLRVHVLVGPADGRSRDGRTIEPDAVVLATGASDRTLPFPGWDLPGVVSAGAAQALAKGERVAVGGRVIVAGAGPFLLPVAQSLALAGARVLGVHEASGAARLARGWLSSPAELVGAASKAGELAGYVGGQLRRRVPYRIASGVVEAHGTRRVEAVTVARLDADWAPVAGTERTIAVDAVAVGHGFTPRLELPIAAGCALTADRFVAVDEVGLTSVPGVYAAGELTGIGGAAAALVEGRLAGTAAAGASPGAADRRARRATDRFAARIERAHGIRPGWHRALHDDTTVCRCEEVTAGEVRGTAAATCASGMRSLRLTSRAGLGICQGRVCGRTVEELFAAAAPGAPPGGLVDRRPIAAPVSLGEIARDPDHQDTPSHGRHTP